MNRLSQVRGYVGFGALILLPFALALVLSKPAEADGPSEVCLAPSRAETVLGTASLEMDGVPCVTDCACVQSKCAAGQRSCSACWMKEHTNRACVPSAAEKPYYGLKCAASTRKNCVADCQCVQAKCPPGTRSCTACWWWEHTQQACSPLEEEKSKYGLSCRPSGS